MYGANPADAIKPVALSQAAITATGNTTGVDVSAFDGGGSVLLATAAPAGTTPTLAAKLQESDTLGGTYTDVPGGAFTALAGVAALEQLPINWTERKAFLRVANTVGGTTPSYPVNIIAFGSKQVNA